MIKHDFPKIHFYDQDFVDIYDKTWAWIQDCWNNGGEKNGIDGKFFSYPDSTAVYQSDAIYSSFFLVYSNRIFQATPTLDLFYNRQEPNGAIRCAYDIKTGAPVVERDNPEGLGIPLFAWAEYNIYHKSANKKRVKDVLAVLHKYTEWINSIFKKRQNGILWRRHQRPCRAETGYGLRYQPERNKQKKESQIEGAVRFFHLAALPKTRLLV